MSYLPKCLSNDYEDDIACYSIATIAILAASVDSHIITEFPANHLLISTMRSLFTCIESSGFVEDGVPQNPVVV